MLKIGVADARLAAALEGGEALSVRVMTREAGEEELRLGRILLFVMAAPDGGVTLRFDDTNPEARTARVFAERALQRAAGVRDAVPVSASVVREAGSRYIDFLIPGCSA
jgi:hypothetical protein